jgi:hypothetical protein
VTEPPGRACAPRSCPPAAPPALDALLAVTAGSAEAQALFVGNGGLDAVARLALGQAAEPGARRAGAAGGGGGGGAGGGGGGSGGGGAAAVAVVARDVRLRCLGFIHIFMGHILSRGVKSGEAPRWPGPLTKTSLSSSACALIMTHAR